MIEALSDVELAVVLVVGTVLVLVVLAVVVLEVEALLWIGTGAAKAGKPRAKNVNSNGRKCIFTASDKERSSQRRDEQ